MTPLQADRIIGDIASVAASADKTLDVNLLTQRFAGPALALRAANYKIRKVDPGQPALPTIQTHVRLMLPQQNSGWPRTVLAVVDKANDAQTPFIALVLVQDDARAQYKVHYAVNLLPGSQIPDVASVDTGTQRLLPDSAFFLLAPSTIAGAYGDVLTHDSASPSFPSFDLSHDSLRTLVGLDAEKAAQKKLPNTAKLTFANEPGPEPVVVLTTLDGGALVATSLDETQTVVPVQKGATVNAPESIKALSGQAVSAKGIIATYDDELLFYVPAKTADPGQIRLLGYDQGPTSASEVDK